MNNASTTLDQFFAANELTSDKISEMVNSADFKPVREKIDKELKGMPLPGSFFETMIKQISDLLNIDIRAILLGAYGQSENFLPYLDADKYPPEEMVLVPLAEHTIVSEHAPSLKPSINKIPLGEIKFKIDLQFILKGVILKIQNGKIWSISAGSCLGRGTVKYGEMPLLSREVELPNSLISMDIDEGIPLKDTIENVHGAVHHLT